MSPDENNSKPDGVAGISPPKTRKRVLVWIVVTIFLLGAAGAIYVFKGNQATAKSASQSVTGKGKTSQRKVLYWVDPMNPAHRSDKPGKAPDGMDLVPVYADQNSDAKDLPPGSVRISSEKQQLIGVQYGMAMKRPLARSIRAVGRIAYDETRIARIQTKVDGWIERVYVDFTGDLVRKGQPVLTLYSPELLAAQKELFIARKSKEELGNSPFKEVGSSTLSLYQSARERLRLWDITDAQIDEIERRGTPIKTLTIHARVSGFVLTRNAFAGQRITPETELYTVADLSRVWVLADVYEYEATGIRIGQAATVTLDYLPGQVFNSKVTYIYPELDKTTRTLKVRLELPNPGYRLKPDMYAHVDIKVDYGSHLTVPAEAVLDSGLEQMVFVVRENGYFEPRKIVVGEKLGNDVIVLEGLHAGERIVTSGNFLIDSESRLKSATGGMAGMGHAGHGAAPASAKAKTPVPAERQTKPKPVKKEPEPAEHEGHSM